MPFEQVAHTADLALKIWADDLKSLFCEAGKALFATITDINKIKKEEKTEIEIKAEGYENLLHDFLEELIFYFDARYKLFCDFEVLELTPNYLKIRCWGESIKGHKIEKCVKAATYHEFEIKKENGKYITTIIFDV